MILAKSASCTWTCPTAADPPSLTKSVNLNSLIHAITHSDSPLSGCQILFGSFFKGFLTPTIIVFSPWRFGLPLTLIRLLAFFGSVLEYSTIYEIPLAPCSISWLRSFLSWIRSSNTISILLVSGQMSSGFVDPQGVTSKGNSYS